jgi:hypothetical protein
VQAELDRQEQVQVRGALAEAVSPDTNIGWPNVDEELAELRRRFRTATTTTATSATAPWQSWRR